MRVFGSIVATLMLIVASCNTLHAEEPNDALSAELAEGSVAEVLVDFGDVKYSECVSRTIVLKNTTNSPIVLLSYETTCRCTWLELPKRAIAPNESGEVTITFDSRGEWGSVGNYLSIETSNEKCNVAVWMCAEIVR
jgi:hypothetical protein